jgi:hypothetical protein
MAVECRLAELLKLSLFEVYGNAFHDFCVS